MLKITKRKLNKMLYIVMINYLIGRNFNKITRQLLLK